MEDLPVFDLAPSAYVTSMDTRTRRAFAAYVMAFNYLPDQDRSLLPIPNGPRARFLRALKFVGLTENEPTHSRAARVSGIPRGTVASWSHRDPGFRKDAAYALRMAAVELAEPDIEPFPQPYREALERVRRLPEVEIVRVAVGEIPSRLFMATAFDEDGFDHPDSVRSERAGWLEALPLTTYGGQSDRTEDGT
jgi:hypothetical protein